MNLHVVVELAVDFRHVRGADAARRLGVAQANPLPSRAVRSTRYRSRRSRGRRRLPGRGPLSTASPGRAGNVAHGSGVTRRRGRSGGLPRNGEDPSWVHRTLLNANGSGAPGRGRDRGRSIAGGYQVKPSSPATKPAASAQRLAGGGGEVRPRVSSPTGGRRAGRAPRRWRRRRPPGRAAPGRCTGACSARRGRGLGPARSPGPAR
jgi:hypothetical protein